jgi:hypothetical protein
MEGLGIAIRGSTSLRILQCPRWKKWENGGRKKCAFQSGVAQELQFDLAKWVWQRQGCILQEFIQLDYKKRLLNSN